MSWLAVAFIAPALWALVALLDTYFVDGIYRDATDGAIISGLFQGLPWLGVAIGAINFNYPGLHVTALAIAAGALFLISFLAYFRALFVANDGAFMQVLWNLSILLVPFLAWLLLDEALGIRHYIGILLAFTGLAAFLIDAGLEGGDRRLIALTMLLAIGALSLSMVLSKQAYSIASTDSGDQGRASFASIFLLYCSGATMVALVLIAKRGLATGLGSARFGFGLRNALAFTFAESLSLGGTFASQRAIDLAPSVSYVAVIESLVPVFIMLFSVAAANLAAVAGNKRLSATYRVQVSSPVRKLVALSAIAGGIYIIT